MYSIYAYVLKLISTHTLFFNVRAWRTYFYFITAENAIEVLHKV